MTAAYRLLIRLLVPFVFVYLWLRGRKAPAYRQRWCERLARQAVPAAARGGILIHCVSVGETVAARQLITQILARYPGVPVTLSSMTPTAASLAQQVFGERVHHVYLPIDTPAAMARFFNKFAPAAVVVLETEVWPCMLRETVQRQLPFMLLNARLSEKSLHSYQRYGWLLGNIWHQLTWVAAQNSASQQRFITLGVPAERAVVRGNLKFDSQVPAAVWTQANALKQQLQRPVWVAASTHKGEDEMVLAAFQQVLQQHADALLILVPRHPERFASVADLVREQGFKLAIRSQQQQPTAQQQVWLGDTMGELLLWYALADVAFIGGSLITRGGHNPLEPVATDTAVVSGPHVFNFQEIFQRLADAQAVLWADNSGQLAEQLLTLLADAPQRQAMQQAARDEFAQDQGATAAMLADVVRHVPNWLQENYAMSNVETLTPVTGEEIWYRKDRFEHFDAAYFDAAHWHNEAKIVGAATGRSTAWFIRDGAQAMLLRHYYRGGLVGKINRDRFKREPIAQSRAMAEFELLMQLRARGLPVPEPLAARYKNAPAWGYRADILVEVIPNAKDVFKLLGEQQLEAAQWHVLGAAIRQLHDAEVYHSDLNCHNIMLDAEDKAWIVDFDKCGFRSPGEWRDANLARLLRSFHKELAKAEEAKRNFHWQEARDWPLLLAGYQHAS
ncbi:lipid IV(A) 3-deoxy-D-manno-octulosonic acid transferase [Pseudidiomarina sediminum]|uniref:lipid IV(A) 3-deoxy-D-manno-octulosonic acid transferase n=1 Tax=Pseudidiomarina sediminum TaxID=431675 RepID=UPI001C984175|nr:lipid IV(A) 3-deoxy-D-manno-octulosonic acid transferase [Pseudidiomarina sediminum]MBY6064638.1 lipid IV(A) 3-deoxy-D-manno-octulosonic acid transferase [Pseudidiomarina sediminum]